MPQHWFELVIVGVVALLFFGPKRLPEMGSAVGKTIKEFRKSMSEITDSATTEAKPTPKLPAANATTVTTPVETTEVHSS